MANEIASTLTEGLITNLLNVVALTNMHRASDNEEYRKEAANWLPTLEKQFTALKYQLTKKSNHTDMDLEADIIERLNEACVGHPHVKIPWPHNLLHDARDEITRLRSEISFARAEGRREGLREAMTVKPLEWKTDDTAPNCHDAVGNGILYRIIQRYDGYAELKIDGYARAGRRSLSDAKAVAQADYEARILSAIRALTEDQS